MEKVSGIGITGGKTGVLDHMTRTMRFALWTGWFATLAILIAALWAALDDRHLLFTWTVNVGTTGLLWVGLAARRKVIIETYSRGYRAGRLDSEHYLREVALVTMEDDEEEEVETKPER